MKTVLVLGAGRSSSALITYLLQRAAAHSWKIVVGDVSEAAARLRIGGSTRGHAILFDIHDEENAAETLRTADVVISLMPAHLHHLVARLCVKHGKHLLNASYVTPEMQALHEEARANNVLLLNECGLDPGIDHMSAMQVIDKIKNEGGNLITFESFTGGLIAPETDPENPWRYKFTWNPRNVVMAGQATAKFLQEGQFKYIPYQQLFKRLTHVTVPDFGEYEGYANRDSLKYINTYGLQGIRNMLRGTLRNVGYCAAWDILVQLGCCEDTYPVEGVAGMTHRDFINSFLNYDPQRMVEEKLCAAFKILPNGPEMKRLRWSGLFDREAIGLREGTPAQVLEHILNKKWRLSPGDKDLIVMWHRFVYETNGQKKEIHASLTATGDDANYTAMSKTVGLPLAIAAKLLLEDNIRARGVCLPVLQEIYEPVLHELNTLGIRLNEQQI
ncbi:MAG TPA: saccharopine dehydrogenase C-terminal domain-containing protein [Cyclobacteriaceae bacterium]|nr:saccharopine dehydrogenase C-terminal domain-containing protein [Cyclobacteriaceae bacterium]